uniref:Uncharacterized protein n=1 Tax=Spongospora subterranea TaxID=70186 RepID=A0A0H5R5C3_9EUKA|eukprot:CRZ09333.1 hypothetical protein [Spongospora subterranea]
MTNVEEVQEKIRAIEDKIKAMEDNSFRWPPFIYDRSQKFHYLLAHTQQLTALYAMLSPSPAPTQINGQISSISPSPEHPAHSSEFQAEAPTPPKRGGDFEPPSRAKLRSKPAPSPMEKLQILMAIRDEIMQKPVEAQITEKCRNFVVTCLNPLLNCLQYHFNNDQVAFLAKYPDLKHSSFGSKFCKGEQNKSCIIHE